MRPVLFRLRVGDAALPEQGHRFNVGMVLHSCVLVCPGPAHYRFTIDGEDTSHDVWVGAPGGGRRYKQLGLVLPAGAVLGLRAVGAGVDGSVTCELLEASGRIVQPEEMLVRWVHGREVLDLYRYAPETRLFTPVNAGWLTGRATITSDADDAVITVAGEDVLWTEGGGIVTAAPWHAGGAAVPGTAPRIEFWTGRHKVATMGYARIAVPFLNETEEVTPAEGEFAMPAAGGTALITFGRAGAQVVRVES